MKPDRRRDPGPGRWSPWWASLAGSGRPHLLGARSVIRPPSSKQPQVPDAPRSSSDCAAATIPAVLAR